MVVYVWDDEDDEDDVFTRMVDTRRDLLARESVMLEVLLLWVSVMFSPLFGSHVPICLNSLVTGFSTLTCEQLRW